MVKVEYMGKREVPARVFVYDDGTLYNAQGYIFGGPNKSAFMTEVEADILTGKTKPVVDDKTGAVKTGFVVQMDLGKAGLTGEKFRIWEAPVPRPSAPKPVVEGKAILAGPAKPGTPKETPKETAKEEAK